MGKASHDASTYEHRGLIRLVVRWFVAIYYPRIEVAGAERIPQSGPLLLCANHANSLIDPVIIGIAARRPVRFMAKAPLFDHPIIGPPMNALGMVPAFRGSDDPKQVRRNLESLDVGAKVLVDGHAMGIFPEGKSTDDIHMDMIRSGAARMAIQAAEQGATGVKVLPMGLTYERKEGFRSSVLVRVAEPIDVDELMAQRDGDGRKARRDVTSELDSRLREVVVHLDEPEWEPWLEDLEALVPPAATLPNTPGRMLWQRKRIADAMNHFLKTDRPRAEAVAEAMETYRGQVHDAGLAVDSQVLRSSSLAVCGKLLLGFLCLLLLLPVTLFGTLYHILPFVIVRLVATRMDQPGRKTIATHRMLVGVPIYLLWYLVVTGLLAIYDARIAICSLAVAPVAGVVALHYWHGFRSATRLLYEQFQAMTKRKRLDELRQQRTALREQLTAFAKEYSDIKPQT